MELDSIKKSILEEIKLCGRFIIQVGLQEIT